MTELIKFSILIAGFPLFLFIIFGVSYHLVLWVRKDSPLKVEGTGDHYVLFCHGMGGSHEDFRNLKKGLDLKKHTLVLLGSLSGHNTLKYDLSQAGGQLIKELNNNINLSKMKKLSIVGHSLGGLYAKSLVYKMHKTNLLENIQLKNFITIATPHLGVVHRNCTSKTTSWYYNSIKSWFLNSFLGNIGPDLDIIPTVPIVLSKTIISKFENKINYISVHFDRSVPFWSSSMRLKQQNYNYEKIKEYKTTLYGNEWRSFTIPLAPYHFFNHGNIVGKYLGGKLTFNNNRIKAMLIHFNKWFI